MEAGEAGWGAPRKTNKWERRRAQDWEPHVALKSAVKWAEAGR